MMFNTKTLLFFSGILMLVSSCTPIRLQVAVPDKFKEQADKLPVEVAGLGQGRKPVRFGPYSTSRIKRGWNITTGRYDRNTQLTSAERLLRAFNAEWGAMTTTQRHRFRFTIRDGQQAADVYALEREQREGSQIIRNSRWLSDLYVGKKVQYSFSAIIIPKSVSNPDPWNFFMYSTFDWTKQRGNPFADIKEGGMLTRGTDTVFIQTIKVDKTVSQKGVEHTIPFALPMAYEMRIDNDVCAVIDPLGRVFWLYRELDEPLKLAVSAVAAALVSRRVQTKLG